MTQLQSWFCFLIHSSKPLYCVHEIIQVCNRCYLVCNRVLKPLRHVSMGAKYSVPNKRTPVFKMASLTIASLLSFFAEEKKSIERGENHYKSDHIESVTYNQGVLRGEVHASMKKKVYKVTVSESRIRLIDRE